MKRYKPNPRFIEYKGRPILSVGSAEHYGAALNADFDFRPYLDAMARDGLNQCRVFSGTYRELPGEFSIAENTLGPRDEAFLCPWKRGSDGRIMAADAWDEAYWTRLKTVCREAGKRGILVEYVLFCYWYNDALWESSPLHRPGIGRHDVYKVDDNPLLPTMEAFVQKAAAELKRFDNVYFEVCNEPYASMVGESEQINAWQRWCCDVIYRADRTRLIALNYQNRTGLIQNPHPRAVIGNFHYALPEAALSNYHLGIVLADDETGFAGQSAEPYRKEAWRFFLAGGSMFSHLDYSFTVAHPDGTGSVAGTKTPGYGGKDLRQQLGFLRKLLEAQKIWELAPRNEALQNGDAPLLGTPDRSKLIVYVLGGSVSLGITGSYSGVWYDPVACRPVKAETHDSRTWTAPDALGEAVLVLEKGRDRG